MKYKGFVIKPYYLTGSDFKILKGTGEVVDKKPTSKDIEYYEIFDPMENDSRHGAEFSIKECKDRIDELLKKLGMKSNLKEDWEKLYNNS